MVTGAHPGNEDRLTTDVHDPTVNIENAIASEQGVATRRHRGLARSGSHRGESVDKITIARFPRNTYDVASLPAAEQAKIEFAANYIIENGAWVVVEGHSDAAGTASAKQAASQARADNVKADLLAKGVPTNNSTGAVVGPRFTRVRGMSSSNPPNPPLRADPAQWRRVEILMAGFPAGTHTPPPGTPTGVTAHTRARGLSALRGSSDPCISLLVRQAYP
jgi:outer membrane protein OmpA-like peptidoglycan-associated protein